MPTSVGAAVTPDKNVSKLDLLTVNDTSSALTELTDTTAALRGMYQQHHINHKTFPLFENATLRCKSSPALIRTRSCSNLAASTASVRVSGSRCWIQDPTGAFPSLPYYKRKIQFSGGPCSVESRKIYSGMYLNLHLSKFQPPPSRRADLFHNSMSRFHGRNNLAKINKSLLGQP